MADGSQKNKEIFEQALAATTRAVTAEANLEVRFTADTPGIVGDEVRIAHLPHKATMQDVAEIRGQADAIALKRRYHDTTLHKKLAPSGTVGRAIFDAVEMARYEAIGARQMPGMKGNLAANESKRALENGLPRPNEDEQAKLAHVVGLLVRERLTGEAAPAEATLAVEGQRKWLEETVGHLLDTLEGKVLDQRGLSVVSRSIISNLLGEGEGDQASPEQSESDQDQQQDNNADSDDESGAEEGEEADGAEASDEAGGEAGEDSSSEAGMEEMDDSDEEIGDGKQRVLLVGEPVEVPDLAEIAVVLESCEQVVAELPRNASGRSEMLFSKSAEMDIDDRIDDELVVAVSHPDDGTNLHREAGLGEWRCLVAEFEVHAVEKIALFGMRRNKQRSQLEGVRIEALVLN